MRMRSFLLMVALLFAGAAFAQDTTVSVTSIESANAAQEQAHLLFERGETSNAAAIYAKIAQSGFGTPSVWSNAGTAAFRSGDVGHAVLYYSRALRKDPSYDRAARSLAFVSPATNAGRSEVLSRALSRFSPIWFVAAAEALFLIFCFAVARLIGTADRERRGHWLAVSAWSFVFLAVAAGVAFASHRARAGGNDAVVLKAGAVTRSAPKEDSVAQLELPAGTIVEMTEEPRLGFVRCKLADGQAGYLATGDLEKI
ncbi:hypothetical protein BH09SUM1_BH09SUM1_23830 [soil metagenome]